MERFIIHGGAPLKGEMSPSGNKNAVLPMLAASLLTDEPLILHLPCSRYFRCESDAQTA